ncbi:MmcQ/YjbR family DNA-binding protein [Neptunicella sp. SCSIO 80796]|uniref:MmcQ/YjbR family DNA-binding protein n=1 Tax=Neptunicella plasticusilytica TaxID=3117012 RepID=UPI003A4E64BC
MNSIQIEQYLLSKPATSLDYPFGKDVKVFKVKTKMFATLAKGKGNKDHYWLNLKCDPDEAVILRDIFNSIIPGYHMNKQQWNTVILDNSVPQGEIERMMDNSYALVVAGMPKKQRLSIEILH